MSTYEPGTVAVATVRGVPNVRVFRYQSVTDPSQGHWDSAIPIDHLIEHPDRSVTDVRPLVALDPEDGMAVAHLLDAARLNLAERGSGADILDRISANTEALQDALRSLTKPTKPAEPLGLGAVVEDAEGYRWVRLDRPVTCWVDGKSFPQRWRDIDAVRVLSEGVSDAS